MVLFSIVIPTYNRASFIEKAINSVLSQSYINWELIVVDDASTDHTMEVLSKYTDPRIHILSNEINRERSAARNKGIDFAQGEYICFLDSDDYYLPVHLETMHREILVQQHPIALLHSDVSVRSTDGLEIRQIHYAYDPIQNITESVLSNHIQPNSVAIHRSILAQFRFDLTLSVNEDVYLFAQISTVFPVIHIAELTVVWVIHTSNTKNMLNDYLTPQLFATQKIFRDPSITVSNRFKRNKYFELYSQLIYFHASNKKSILSISYFIKGLLISPLNRNNRTNLLNVIYHLPGGKWIKQIVQLFKNEYVK